MRISTVAILTCDRTELLRRCLTSCVQNVKAYQREIHFQILDDSLDAKVRQATIRMLQEIGTFHRLSISYAGLEEKRAYCQEIKRLAPDLDESIDFSLTPAVGGPTIGANRNAALLAAVSDCYLCLDDDTVCDVYASVTPPIGLALSSSPILELLAFTDPASALASAQPVNADAVALHEKHLGQTLDACMDDYLESGVDVKQVGPFFAKKIVSEKGRIRLTWMGVIGDSGFRYPTYLLTLQGKAREKVVKDDATYRMVCRSRQIRRAPERVTVGGEQGFYGAAAMGLDHREMLPPFLPVGRGEDGMFGSLFQACFTDDFTAYLPWMIRHDPQPPRQSKPEDVRRFGHTQFHDVLRAVIERFPLQNLSGGTTHGQRLTLLGAYIQELAGKDLAPFREAIQSRLQQQMKDFIPSLEKALHRHNGQPRAWAADVKGAIQNMKALGNRPEFCIPEEFLPGRTQEQAWELTQNLTGRFGRLLTDWEKIIETARRLKSENITLTRRIN